MSLRFWIIFILCVSCSRTDFSKKDGADISEFMDVKDVEGGDILKVKLNCSSSFSPCMAGVTLIIGEDDGSFSFKAFSTFEKDQTSLVFSLNGDPKELEGNVVLADTREGRALPPLAGLVKPLDSGNAGESKSIVWQSIGDTIQVSFPRPDVIKIVYDIGLAEVLDLSKPHRRIKGEFTAPIRVRCYTGIPGSGEGVRDSDFSSDFCKKYVKHNYKFPPKPPIDDDY